jgi:hypothetical protein|tara:strand:- start:484 stop:924 length:441 start_codon:yes stop_codon:yes gene_type:complete
MATAKDKRVSELRKQARDINKELRALQNVERISAGMASWKAVDELKQKYEAELKKHKMTMKKLIKMPIYYTLAEVGGTRKARDKSEPWVQEALASGTSEAQMIKEANRLREAYARRTFGPKRRKKTTVGAPFGSGKQKATAQMGVG